MTRLYRWHAETVECGRIMLFGVVTGHRKLPDGMYIHTSPVISVFRDSEKENGYVFKTGKSEFHVSMTDCEYAQCMIASGEDIPGFDQWRAEQEQYSKQFVAEKALIEAEKGSILLRLGNNREYYFDAIDVDPGTGEHLSSGHSVHVGMFQDSVLCWAGDDEWCSEYDLSYFPYRNGNVEFYTWDTLGLPVDIENCGDCELRVEVNGAVYVIAPLERVRIERKNAIPGQSLTSTRDLYDVWGAPDKLP